VAGRAAQVEQRPSARSSRYDHPERNSSYMRFDVDPLDAFISLKPCRIDLVVEMTDVTDDRFVFIL
jgi:hypothetical protein